MKLHRVRGLAVLLGLAAGVALADDWSQFRGRDATGTSTEKNLPIKWAETENIAWRAKLPGPGSSSPIITGDKIFLTCYSGYGVEEGEGSMNDLTFHVLCVDRKSGDIAWDKRIKASLPETPYKSYMLNHGYASSTPATDGKHVYFFFGKTGVFCFDLDGNQVWRKSVGTGKHGWGSAASPVLYKDKVIINASVESGKLVALRKDTGDTAWTGPGISQSWSTPVLVELPGGQTDLVVSGTDAATKAGGILGIDPDTGNSRWKAKAFKGYVCPTVLPHDGVIYALQKSPGDSASLAVKCGGQGDVTSTNTLWKKKYTSITSSPVYHGDHLYFCTEGGVAYCLKAATGEEVYKKALSPKTGIVYASPLLADGKIYYVSQHNGTYVIAASPEFKQLAHNVFANDNSRTNASPIADRGSIILRTDQYLYCIGKKL